MFEKLNETVADLKRTVETTSANNIVKQELLATKQEMTRLREEVSLFQTKNQWRPSNGAWSEHNQAVHGKGKATLVEPNVVKQQKQGKFISHITHKQIHAYLSGDSLFTFVQQRLIRPKASVPKKPSPEMIEPRPLKMLKPPPKNLMTFRTYSADDYKAVYVEITPSRFSQIRSDLHAAGIATKKVINISFINGRTAEFVIQKSYEDVFKKMVGKEFFIHENFDPSRPMDLAAPASVISAFRKSFAQRIQNIILNSCMAIVCEFYKRMGDEKRIPAFHRSVVESTSEVRSLAESNEESSVNFRGQVGTAATFRSPVDRVIETHDGLKLLRSANTFVIDTQSPTSPNDGLRDERISITSEELRIIESQLAREIVETEDFPEFDLPLQTEKRSNKGKKRDITFEDHPVHWIKTEIFDEERSEHVDMLIDEDVDVLCFADQPSSSRKKRRVFQKLNYTSSTDTNEYENMDFSQ
jgi:hypothetical protein